MKLRIGRKYESKEEISIPTAFAISHMQIYLSIQYDIRIKDIFLKYCILG